MRATTCAPRCPSIRSGSSATRRAARPCGRAGRPASTSPMATARARRSTCSCRRARRGCADRGAAPRVHSRRLLAVARPQGLLVRRRRPGRGGRGGRRCSATSWHLRPTWTRSSARPAGPSPGCTARPPTHGIDAGRICLAGHSAGGHLAAMALATDWTALGLPADLIKGVCAISGVFDLEPIRLCYLNDVLGLDAKPRRAATAPCCCRRAAAVPVLLTVGERETEAFHRKAAPMPRRCGVRTCRASSPCSPGSTTSPSSWPWRTRPIRRCAGSWRGSASPAPRLDGGAFVLE